MNMVGRLPGSFNRRIGQLVHQGNPDGRQDEDAVNDGLPHHAGFGVGGLPRRQPAGLDEGPQQMDRRDADDGHRQLDLQDAGVDMAEPFRLVGMTPEIEARDERLVTADDHHDEKIRDHDDVDQAQHRQHDLLLAEIEGVSEQMPKLLDEQYDVDALRDDQPDIERNLQPARAEDHHGNRAQRNSLRLHAHVGGNGHQELLGWNEIAERYIYAI